MLAINLLVYVRYIDVNTYYVIKQSSEIYNLKYIIIGLYTARFYCK